MVKRVVHLGFEVRVELELKGGDPARVQLTRGQAEELEITSKNIDECCRVAAGTQIGMTVTSAKEMHLILAEAALAVGNAAEFRSRINTVRAIDALPATTSRPSGENAAS